MAYRASTVDGDRDSLSPSTRQHLDRAKRMKQDAEILYNHNTHAATAMLEEQLRNNDRMRAMQAAGMRYVPTPAAIDQYKAFEADVNRYRKNCRKYFRSKRVRKMIKEKYPILRSKSDVRVDVQAMNMVQLGEQYARLHQEMSSISAAFKEAREYTARGPIMNDIIRHPDEYLANSAHPRRLYYYDDDEDEDTDSD